MTRTLYSISDALLSESTEVSVQEPNENGDDGGFPSKSVHRAVARPVDPSRCREHQFSNHTKLVQGGMLSCVSYGGLLIQTNEEDSSQTSLSLHFLSGLLPLVAPSPRVCPSLVLARLPEPRAFRSVCPTLRDFLLRTIFRGFPGSPSSSPRSPARF